jgi:hypothetical protein
LPRLIRFSTVRLTWISSPMPRSLQWVNSPVLLEALERYEQQRLPRSMQLWLEAVLELKAPAQGPLRPHC